MLLRHILLFLSRRHDLEEFLKHNSLARHAARRFVAGESRSEALAVAEKLNREGLLVTLDYLGEEVSDPDQAAAAAEEYAGAVEEAAARGIKTGVSVKLSHLGVRIDEELALRHLLEVVRRAAVVGRFVRVDMEGSDLTEATLHLVRKVHRKYRNIGAVIQSALRRSDEDLNVLNREEISVRLVKGAYLEPEEVAFQNKEEVDLYYMRLTEALIHSGTRPAFATHDEKLIAFVVDLADIFAVGKDDFEFQMLYGVCRDLQRQLAADGYRVRVYLPYGADWYAYFMRRLAERPANILFLMRHLRE